MSPIIATLLLIAISVASGIVVYAFTNGLAANLTKSGGNQVTEQLTIDAYSYTTPSSGNLVLYVRDTGTTPITMASFYANGASITGPTFGSPCTVTGGITAGQSCSLTWTSIGGLTVNAETTVAVKIVTSNGAAFTYNVVAGQTG